MKKTLYLLSILSILLTGCGSNKLQHHDPNKLTSITIVDRNEFSETITNEERLKQYQNVDFTTAQPYKKVLRIYQRDKLGNIRATMTTYHENGQAKQLLEIVNSRAFGSYKEWHENGALKLDSCVIGGEADLNPGCEKSWVFDGRATGYDEDCNKILTIQYKKGSLEGKSLYFHANGNLWKSVPFEKGIVHGQFEIFRENGDPLQSSTFCNGVKHGSSTRFWDNDAVACNEEYNTGVLVNSRSYDKNRNLVVEVQNGNGFRALFGRNSVAELQQYINGAPEGEVKVYSEDNRLIRLYHVKDGEKHGEEIEFFPRTTQPKISLNWAGGKLQGVIKTWYPTGQQESQREISNNNKNGLLTAWYQKGELMLIEEYDSDKLVKGKYFKKGEKHPVSTIRNGEGEATLFDSNGNFIRKVTYRNSLPLID